MNIKIPKWWKRFAWQVAACVWAAHNTSCFRVDRRTLHFYWEHCLLFPDAVCQDVPNFQKNLLPPCLGILLPWRRRHRVSPKRLQISTKPRHIPGDGILLRHLRQNLKSPHRLFLANSTNVKTLQIRSGLNSICCRLKPRYRPGQAQRVIRNLRFPDFVTMAQDGGRLSALRTDCFYPQKIILVLISDRGWVDPKSIVRSEGFYVNEKSTDTSWYRTSDLPICSTAPTVLPRSPADLRKVLNLQLVCP